jgi:haloalkane dehalogenase
LNSDIHRHYIDVTRRSSERVAQLTLARSLVGASDWYASLWEQRATLATVPAHIIWGMKDPTFGPEELQRWCALFPDTGAIRLEEVGHFPQEEATKEVLGTFRKLVAG